MPEVEILFPSGRRIRTLLEGKAAAFTGGESEKKNLSMVQGKRIPKREKRAEGDPDSQRAVILVVKERPFDKSALHGGKERRAKGAKKQQKKTTSTGAAKRKGKRLGKKRAIGRAASEDHHLLAKKLGYAGEEKRIFTCKENTSSLS